MHRMTKTIATLAVMILALFAFAACDEPKETSGQKSENATRQSNYDRLVKAQPAATMDYSPTRDTKNFWINTWDKKGKLSYVYLLNQDGEPYSFAVFKRLPVTYCTSMVPPMQKVEEDKGEYNGETYIPGPSIDGTYSSSANCGTQYGEDATTGAYVEFTPGMGTTVLLRDQPLPVNAIEGAIPLGDTTAEQSVKAE